MAASDHPPATYNIVNELYGDSVNDTALPLGVSTAYDFAPLADGYYLIVSETTGKVLQDPNLSTSPGTGVNFTTQLTGGVNQQWFFQPSEFAGRTPPLRSSAQLTTWGWRSHTSATALLVSPRSLWKTFS